MATLIAQHTIQGAQTEPLFDKAGEPLRDARGRHRHRQIEPILVAPGEEFDPADLGISEQEVVLLITSGAVRERGTIGTASRSSPSGAAADDLPSDEELEAMTRSELDMLAAARGVDVSKAKNKGEVIDALVASVS